MSGDGNRFRIFSFPVPEISGVAVAGGNHKPGNSTGGRLNPGELAAYPVG